MSHNLELFINYLNIEKPFYFRLMCALGCFKQNFPLVTLYANLGEDAITFGVCQTEVTHVITTHELLPKFKNVLHNTPNVKVVIFFEDQVHTTDRTGYVEPRLCIRHQLAVNLNNINP